ncbi:hypothetical protein AB0K92_20355 [Streptomyces sp. NPDC052687]|uniref:hypothetical protein n=1 Tax=Streptomyces sp. NPDC052687 TaxID=3154759 RepID=UPI00343B2601
MYDFALAGAAAPGGPAGLVVDSVILLYLTAVPACFFLPALRVRRVSPDLAIPLLPVAFVVTRAPSEPWSTARRTLQAMLGQDSPYARDV